MTTIQIAASTMAAPSAALGSAIKALDAAGIDMFHWDIMDGHFVPNLTFGPQTVRDARALTQTPFDIHLLVTEPQKWISPFAESGANSISFHTEVTDDPMACIDAIHAAGCQAGMAINPETSLDGMDQEIFAALDRLVIMTVKPGFGGQCFIQQEAKIRQAAALRILFPKLDIMVDGGISSETAPSVITQGATTLVSGSALMHSTNHSDMIRALKGERI